MATSPSVKECPKPAEVFKSELKDVVEHNKLHHQVTQEKNAMPTKEDIEQEKTEKTYQQIIDGVVHFNPKDLKHQEVDSKPALPSKEEYEQIKEEKTKFRENIEQFDKSQLKNTETQEKIHIPTVEEIEAEKKGSS